MVNLPTRGVYPFISVLLFFLAAKVTVVIIFDNYENIDGRYAYNTDAKVRLEAGMHPNGELQKEWSVFDSENLTKENMEFYKKRI